MGDKQIEEEIARRYAEEAKNDPGREQRVREQKRLEHFRKQLEPVASKCKELRQEKLSHLTVEDVETL